jgi:hypothetical protein
MELAIGLSPNFLHNQGVAQKRTQINDFTRILPLEKTQTF